MARGRREPAGRWAATFAVSLVLHALAGISLPIDFEPSPRKQVTPKPQTARAVPILTESQAKKMLARAKKQQPTPPVPKKPEEKKKPDPPKPDGQIVEIPPPPKEEVPDEARFLSEYNSKVEREQRARANQSPSPRMRKSDRKVIANGNDLEGVTDRPPQPPKPKPDRPVAEVEKPGDSKRASKTKGPDAPPTPEKRTVVTPKTTPAPEGDGNIAKSDKNEPHPFAPPGGGEVGGSPKSPTVRELLAAQGPVEMAPQQGSIDHIDDIDRGERTFLNTREYKYAFFFNRMKRNVQQRWGAVDAHRRNDPYGRIHGVRDRLTVVQVTLGPDGVLENIEVTKDSGTPFLDDAAVQAFREASPFHNPPKGLRDADGRIRFEFSFYLEISSRGFRFR